VLRKIFGRIRGQIKLYSEEFRDLCSSPRVIRVMKSRRMRWAGHVAGMGYRRVEYRLLVGKPEGNRRLERSTLIWEDNSNTDLQKIGLEGVNWVDVAQDMDKWRAVVNAATKLRVP
jgi:hypothetical protein